MPRPTEKPTKKPVAAKPVPQPSRRPVNGNGNQETSGNTNQNNDGSNINVQGGNANTGNKNSNGQGNGSNNVNKNANTQGAEVTGSIAENGSNQRRNLNQGGGHGGNGNSNQVGGQGDNQNNQVGGGSAGSRGRAARNLRYSTCHNAFARCHQDVSKSICLNGIRQDDEPSEGGRLWGWTNTVDAEHGEARCDLLVGKADCEEQDIIRVGVVQIDSTTGRIKATVDAHWDLTEFLAYVGTQPLQVDALVGQGEPHSTVLNFSFGVFLDEGTKFATFRMPAEAMAPGAFVTVHGVVCGDVLLGEEVGPISSW